MDLEKNVSRFVPIVETRNIPIERFQFKKLLAQNPNYFGNIAKSELKPVKKIATNTEYEELTCVGFNPQTSMLEATIAVKLPYGYGGARCMAGTTEYVRFFIDYGSGWEDLGVAGVKVHDIPTGKDCAGQADKPLIYVASLKFDPKAKCCGNPVLPKVHAILSWEWKPPGGAANVGWIPPWGNTFDCYIQIKPLPWSIFCLIEQLSQNIGQKIEIPPLVEQVKFTPLPIPDKPSFNMAENVQLYGAKSGTTASGQQLKVEAHRFGVQDLHAAIASKAGFNADALEAKASQWKSLGLDWNAAIAALNETNANTSYEQLECLGIDEILPERLVATFRIKRPFGYSGELCSPGSQEFVAFWADWDDKCQWTYLGTVAVNVHDFKDIPNEGLCYSAILPVDLTYERQSCKKPKIGRIRAVLSWAIPPSTTDPESLNYWGNRLESHIQINPGDMIDPKNPLAKIRNIGGIPVEDIWTTPSMNPSDPVGMTLSSAVFAHYPAFSADGWGLGRPCPFGGQIKIEGNFYNGFYYRVKVHRIGDPYASFTVLADSFKVERWDTGFDLQTSVSGFYKYLDPATHADNALAYWTSTGDDLWDIQLDIATAPNEASIISSSPWYIVQLDNTAPQGPPAVPLTMDIHISSGTGDCMDAFVDDPIKHIVEGMFVADDKHFGAWSLATLPNTLATPSNQPTVIGLAQTDAAPAPSGHNWRLDTNTPIKMHPCGYVVQLVVYDRTIVNSFPGQHNGNHIEVGFCLRAGKSP